VVGPTIPVKVCCIQDAEELDLAVRCGARMVGLVSQMPSGWGPIPDERIAQLARRTPPGVVSVLLTSRTEPDAVVEQQRVCRANALQLVDEFPLEGYTILRNALPGVTILKAVHVTSSDALDQALHIAPHVDGIILDTGAPNPDEGPRVLGGTGQTHDWSISQKIVEHADCPVFLAGGLNVDNVADAVATVSPWGLDLCTGVRVGPEDDLRLDEARLRAFMDAVPNPR